MSGRRTKIKNTRAAIPRNHPKTNWMALLHFLFVSTLLALIGAYALQTPDLKIQPVEVSGVQLADSVKVDNISDWAKGKNILLVRKSVMIRRLEKLNEIESVKIGRHFPDVLWVQVTERKPIASLKTVDGYAYIAEDGMAFHKSSSPASGKPVLVVSGCNKIELRKPNPSANLEYVLSALTSVRAEKLECKKIFVDQRANLCLNMNSGLLVKLGQPDDIPTKIKQLRRTLEFKPSLEQEALYVDVSCPSEKV